MAKWIKRQAVHGFIDFRHFFRPNAKGVSPTESGVAVARCILHVPHAMKADLYIAWDDLLTLRLNEDQIINMGRHEHFRCRHIVLNLKEGINSIILKLSNEVSYNHGGWALKLTSVQGLIETLRSPMRTKKKIK